MSHGVGAAWWKGLRGGGMPSALGNEAIWLNVDSHGPFMGKAQASCEGLGKNPKNMLGEVRGRI